MILSFSTLEGLTEIHVNRRCRRQRSHSPEHVYHVNRHVDRRHKAKGPRAHAQVCVALHVEHEGRMANAHVTLDLETPLVKIVVLGSPGVGKTSIIQQFMGNNNFSEHYSPTLKRECYYPSIVVNEHLFEARITDCPYIPYFPTTSLSEWTDFRGYGLRSATAYILVFDITSEDSFSYIRTIREQMAESRDMHDVPIYVVGNKHDLGDDRGVSKREVANLVKKQWKCGYIECSAKYNWHIITLFKELMKAIEVIDHGHKPTAVRVQDAFRRNRCTIL